MPDPINNGNTPEAPTPINSTPTTPVTPEAPTTPEESTPETQSPEAVPVAPSTPETTMPTTPENSMPETLQNVAPINVAPREINDLKSLLQKAKEKIQFRKRAKLEKIMAAASNKASQVGSGEASRTGITNNDVQKLLRCSDATATRYLSELVKQGRLRRVGEKKGIFYDLVR